MPFHQKIKNLGRMTLDKFQNFVSREINIDSRQPNIAQSLGKKTPEEFQVFKEEKTGNINEQFIKQTNIPPQIEQVTPKRISIPEPTEENTIAGINFANYATDPNAIPAVRSIFESTSQINKPEDAQQEIDRVMRVINQANPPRTEITGDMILSAARRFGIDPRLLIALLRRESQLGIRLSDINRNNPGNIGITDEGGRRTYNSMKEGVEAVARELARRRVSA